jgi:hypothetical protein
MPFSFALSSPQVVVVVRTLQVDTFGKAIRLEVAIGLDLVELVDEQAGDESTNPATKESQSGPNQI